MVVINLNSVNIYVYTDSRSIKLQEKGLHRQNDFNTFRWVKIQQYEL